MPDLESRIRKLFEYLEVHADDREPFSSGDSSSGPAASVPAEGEGEAGTCSGSMSGAGVESATVSTASPRQRTHVEQLDDSSAPAQESHILVVPPTLAQQQHAGMCSLESKL